LNCIGSPPVPGHRYGVETNAKNANKSDPLPSPPAAAPNAPVTAPRRHRSRAKYRTPAAYRTNALARAEAKRQRIEALRASPRAPGTHTPSAPAHKRRPGLTVGALVRARQRNRATEPLTTKTVTTAAPPRYVAGRDQWGGRIRVGFGKVSAVVSHAPGWQVGSAGHGAEHGASTPRVAAQVDALWGSNAKAIAEGRVSPFAESGKEKS
jgi:hypothetical protein